MGRISYESQFGLSKSITSGRCPKTSTNMIKAYRRVLFYFIIVDLEYVKLDTALNRTDFYCRISSTFLRPTFGCFDRPSTIKTHTRVRSLLYLWSSIRVTFLRSLFYCIRTNPSDCFMTFAYSYLLYLFLRLKLMSPDLIFIFSGEKVHVSINRMRQGRKRGDAKSGIHL